jgi:hypothetical protein
MRTEAELAGEGIKEASPLTVVQLGEIELNGNMVFDVDCLEHGGGRRLDEGLGERNSVDRRVGGGIAIR